METKFIHTPSGVVFENRKQAIKCMGRSRYCKALSKRDFEFSKQEDKLC